MTEGPESSVTEEIGKLSAGTREAFASIDNYDNLVGHLARTFTKNFGASRASDLTLSSIF
jgi:hypothetical protein